MVSVLGFRLCVSFFKRYCYFFISLHFMNMKEFTRSKLSKICQAYHLCPFLVEESSLKNFKTFSKFISALLKRIGK